PAGARGGMYTFSAPPPRPPSPPVSDAPDGNAACTRRNRSNTPLQALTLLNDQGQYEFARALAARVLREGGTDDAARLRYAFRLCLARAPKEREQQRLTEVLAREGKGPEAWVTVARGLLNLDAFIRRE